SIFATALLAASMALATSMGTFLALRFLAGVASAFTLVLLTTIVFEQLAAAKREELAALHFGGVGLGIAASSLMIGLSIARDADWRAGWWWAGILSLAGALLVAWLARAAPQRAGAFEREPPAPESTSLTRMVIAYGLF